MKKCKQLITMMLTVSLLVSLAACSQGNGDPDTEQNGSAATSQSEPTDSSAQTSESDDTQSETPAVTELYVRFGDEGEVYTLHLYDNETAAAIARHVGTADWRLPIYHYDDYEDWEVMQYYDIPSRYEIPSNPESVTSEQAGTVYYPEPNRIILFYRDAEVPGDYTPVGYFDVTEEFVSAVENNPVLEGWGNKIVQISASE